MNNYLLAIRNNDGDYYPVRWELTPMRYCQKENERGQVPSLEVIDRYTSFHEADTLIEELIKSEAIDAEHQDKPLVIIYHSDGKTREVTNGVLYSQDLSAISSSFIKDFIIDNSGDKGLLNKIYNKFANREENSQALKDVMYLIKKIDYISRIQHDFTIALSSIDELPYIERRNLGLYIKHNLLVNEDKLEEDSGYTLKKNGE